MTIAQAADAVGVKPATVKDWKYHDPEFQDLLADAEERAVEAFLEEGVRQVRNQIMDLGPRAADVLRESLEHSDPKVRLQAAGMVLRHGGGPGENVNIGGLERALGLGDSNPATGD